ncbi:MAG: hypothetical protein HY332_09990 [Chloroflexi bacterium]|nr:hypothetical protein [Chloroflexota bacterium]
MSAPKPRLIINCATADLDVFQQVARAATSLVEHYSVRLVVSHLAQRNTRMLTDPGDPYLQYSVNFPSLFDFVVPQALAPYAEHASVETNLGLLAAKMAVLRDVGVKAAFFGREPVYFPEPIFRAYPHWRGPRVDHPRRSRNPAFAPCVHQPAVQRLYREAAEQLGRRFPEVDTFYWWTNDSGAGFCWYPFLYPGPNGPASCRDRGALTSIAGFHAAVLDGARAGGVGEPMSIMTQVRVWDERIMPAGAYQYPSHGAKGGVLSIHADLSMTYPVRYLADPLGHLQRLSTVPAAEPAAVICWLSDVYHRAHAGVGTSRRLFALWALAAKHAAATRRLPGRLMLLQELAAAEFGAEVADDVVDGWLSLHEAFTLQQQSPFRRPSMRYLPTYGPVSHRWLTRPLVAFPERLMPEDECYFLPHVFAVGDEARRHNLLDVHGYPAAHAGDDYDLRSAYFAQIVSHFKSAAAHFDRAAQRTGTGGSGELVTMARAARLMACIWTTCRHWLEFAVLRAQGVEQADEVLGPLVVDERTRVETYRRRLHETIRAELDNTLALQEVLGDDSDLVVARGASAEEEDTFTLGPDLQAQLTRKRELMLAHWQDVARLYPALDQVKSAK